MKNKIVFLLVVVSIIGSVHDEAGGFLTTYVSRGHLGQKKLFCKKGQGRIIISSVVGREKVMAKGVLCVLDLPMYLYWIENLKFQYLNSVEVDQSEPLKSAIPTSLNPAVT